MIKEERPNELSNFSIEHILNRAGTTCHTIKRRYHDPADHVDQETDVGGEKGWAGPREHKPEHNIFLRQYEQYAYQWLSCTRYEPPRINRMVKKEGAKRRPGRHPRIPFTPLQIEELETSYRNCPYLNTEEISRLANALDLPDARIKIWFQNRRAREKREKVNVTTTTSEDGQYSS